MDDADANADADGDGVCASVDNCPGVSNADQLNGDGDEYGDACDPCINDPDNGDDSDGDGVCAPADNCPGVGNADQADADADGIGDACDACPNDPQNDADGDGVCGDIDNCPRSPMPSSSTRTRTVLATNATIAGTFRTQTKTTATTTTSAMFVRRDTSVTRPTKPETSCLRRSTKGRGMR